MGRQQVIQITCDRCTRVEHRPESDAPPNGEPAFRGMFLGKKVKYDDLCSGCEAIIGNHWEKIEKELQKASPIRKKKS